MKKKLDPAGKILALKRLIVKEESAIVAAKKSIVTSMKLLSNYQEELKELRF